MSTGSSFDDRQGSRPGAQVLYLRPSWASEMHFAVKVPTSQNRATQLRDRLDAGEAEAMSLDRTQSKPRTRTRIWWWLSLKFTHSIVTGGARLERLLKNPDSRALWRRLKPTRNGNKRLGRWPEGQHYPNNVRTGVLQQAVKACSTPISPEHIFKLSHYRGFPTFSSQNHPRFPPTEAEDSRVLSRRDEDVVPKCRNTTYLSPRRRLLRY